MIPDQEAYEEWLEMYSNAKTQKEMWWLEYNRAYMTAGVHQGDLEKARTFATVWNARADTLQTLGKRMGWV